MSKVAPEILPDENFEDDNGSCIELEQSFVLKSTKKTISNNHQRIIPFNMPVNKTFKKDKKQINSSEIYTTPGSILQKKTSVNKMYDSTKNLKSPKSMQMSQKPKMIRGPQQSVISSQ